MSIRLHLASLSLLAPLLLCSCATSKKERNCEKLKDRVITISSGLAGQMQKWKPEGERVDEQTMRREMREKLEGGDFMKECMRLDPDEVDCLANAQTREEWVECGFDQVMLP